MKCVSLLRKLQYFSPFSNLPTIYKSFIRLHLGYGDVIYDQLSNGSFFIKIESVQYYAALTTTGARVLSREKLYQKLRLEHLYHRHWMGISWLFCKVLSNKVPKYIYELVLTTKHHFRNHNWFIAFPCRTKFFRIPFSVCHKSPEQTRRQNSQFYFLCKFKKCATNFIIIPFLNHFYCTRTNFYIWLCVFYTTMY